jgi:hypothetical protein
MKCALWLSIHLIITSCAAAGTTTPYSPQQGDIVFQSLPHMPVIDAIEGSTHSPYSHCGIVVKQGNVWHVMEAIGPVRLTRLERWSTQGRKEEFAVCRLKSTFQPKVDAMITAAEKFIGLPYDIQYEMDDEKIYCSELIYKGFLKASGERMGKTVKLGDLDWRPHEKVIRAIAGDPLPLDREMITPRDLAKAEQLEAVLPFEQHIITR